MNKLKHLAIIMDGNRRWARKKGLPVFEGHRHGYQTLKEVGEWCRTAGIKFLTVFAFSTENWQRTKQEVNYLNKLIVMVLKNDLDWFNQRGWRIRLAGDLSYYSNKIRAGLQEAEQKTKNNQRATLIICLSYGGRDEIINAVKKIVAHKKTNQQINEKLISQNLYLPDVPDPDLILRTGNELRLSNFLLWQAAYSELYFTPTLWPDFSKAEFNQILKDFQRRQRRFGR